LKYKRPLTWEREFERTIQLESLSGRTLVLSGNPRIEPTAGEVGPWKREGRIGPKKGSVPGE